LNLLRFTIQPASRLAVGKNTVLFLLMVSRLSQLVL